MSKRLTPKEIASKYDLIVECFQTVENQHLALERIAGMLKPKGVGLLTCGVKEGELNLAMFGEEFYYSSPSVERYIEWITRLGCEVVFSEIDQPTGDGHAVICFQQL